MTYVAASEVTTLEHELGDDAVEEGALVVFSPVQRARKFSAVCRRGQQLLGEFCFSSST
jgi:hypothetical protein